MNDFYDKLIPGTYGGFKEGDFVKTTGWLHLAAYSVDNDDYHIQINGSKSNLKSCAIVEIPDPVNAPNDSVRKQWEQGSTFINSLFKGKTPPKEPKHLMSKPIHVQVSGQLLISPTHYSRKPWEGGHEELGHHGRYIQYGQSNY